MTGRLHHLVIGGLISTALFFGVAWLSYAPSWRSVPEGMALVRLSFTHSGDRSATCRDRTPEELAKLPPNMRATQICDRRRPPIYVELLVDGDLVYAEERAPSGLAGSGPSRLYERVLLPAGTHTLLVRMRDNPASEGFDFQAERRVELAPEQSFVIDFRKEEGFVFQ
ncbi:hypothetical protein [Maritimibacter fusiformis]|uniref:Uncharacterized protein n=1 Tax=Maritimibacter fusiformis TaxID=2603819 RepID=A0A5D0R8K4_9RHOB|nr:hypothetical protein [Maritimibacter fusiformis]TYB77832.1 hypothetical protein FVF75_16440 [Maritimibacter fusiformis]